jgi:DNA-binding transcriptional regulator LsrR (DeoR family)
LFNFAELRLAMPRSKSVEDTRMLTKVSKLYYEEGLLQDEIVARLNLSRSKVSRLLQQARDEGIVRITVLEPPGVYADLENSLENRYHLQEAIVVEAHQPESQVVVSREIGIAAARYLARDIQPNDTIGISWGSTLNEMVEHLEPMALSNVHVVQIIGGLGRPESEIHATDLCRRMAHRLGCKMTLLPAPGIVDDQTTRNVYLSDSHVQRAINHFSGIREAYVGIGSPAPDSVVMRDGYILSQNEMDQLLSKGAVGDIALRYFDAYGQPVVSEIDRRVIGMDLEEFSRVERVIGVTGGPQKTAAILGALRGHHIDVLITDHATALRLLDADPQTRTR